MSTLSFAQATITIDVVWPSWAEENRVLLRNSSNTTLGTVCMPTNCFTTDFSNDTYTGSQSFPGIPFGTNYYIRMEDGWGDGWNGASSVTVRQDGVIILTSDLTVPLLDVSFDILAPTPTLDVTDVAIDENNGPAVFTVEHIGASASGSFSANYSITAGSATQGVDYSTSSGLYTGTLNFNGTVGDTEQITVLITNDFDFEPNETYTIQFTSVTDVSVDITDTATGTINNDDVEAVILIDNETETEDSGSMIFTATHTGGDRPASFTVDYVITAGTASEGVDYTTGSGFYTGTLSFDGTASDTDVITISITDDSFFETSENFTISFTSSTDGNVNIADTATGTIDDDEIILNDQPLTLFEQINGYYDYAVTGGTFRTQSNGVNACTITNTSSATGLTTTVPGTGTIERAYLIWAHSNPTPDTNVTFQGQSVEAQLVNSYLHSGNRDFYGMVADVTTIIDATPNVNTTTFTVTNLTIDNSATYCNSATVLGGWSLLVFYEELSLPAVTINFYNGFDGGSDAVSTFTLSGFYAIGSAGSKTSVLSWEGDDTLANNENLQFITTSAGTNTLSGDGGQTGTNPFNSTIYDNTAAPVVNNSNIYGVDLDTYDVSTFLQQGESSATTRVQVGQDLVIMNSVLLKVPSNLITGTVFEDVNYGGGNGRDLAASSGVPIPGTTVELYDNAGNLFDTQTTDVNGAFAFGGMADGSYSLRAVNSTVRSTRSGGSTCTSCVPVQTFRTNFGSSTLTGVTTEIGGANPAGVDTIVGVLTGAQSVASVSISSEGAIGMDFGFNFNTIVNTNEDGQGSLEQFIVNANTLNASGIDIVTNSIFDPVAGDDTSIFMIPPTSDPLGRTADSNFASGYFDISISNGSPLSAITGPNIVIDGRTQTAYSGDTNSGTIGAGGTAVGTSSTNLQNFELPEIQVHRSNGDVFQIQGDNDVIRNLAIYADQRTAILFDDGSGSTVSNSLIGVNALGVNAGISPYGVEIEGTTVTNLFVESNYIATTTNAGVFVNGGTGTKTIQGNHIFNIGDNPCDLGIDIRNGSNGVLIQNNLIEDSQGIGVKSTGGSGGVDILENTITGSGQNTGTCVGNPGDFGISMIGSNNQVVNNVIYDNGGAGLVLNGSNTSGNLISRNSFYNNGTNGDALGIDLNGDGVTLNDSGDGDSGPNGLLNFPIIQTAYKSGSNVVVSGWSRPGATIEFFLTDVNQGTATLGDNQLGLSADYGEGQVFLATLVEGSGSDTDSGTSFYFDDDSNTDNTNKFSFTFAVPPGVLLGDDLTATATIANSTSEFSPFSKLKAFTVITNRRITYRVKKD
ncbi:S-layer family protein [Maribacter algarum]|uniref:beta strand repeat-containing protein n=1 Tax=Maribacter algarum (ex Zhang et al. 2020) TaxID=2578118 RepID=UPI0014871357|nr:Calx-beta domain-containing protein [Maribacter algarum]